ncbi:MAG: acyl carrier protein [Clostridia bacterium]|nr:acyl carrier protein [Clostridia bacterium]
MRETILDILEELNDDCDFEHAQRIIDDKLLDSFEIVALVTELRDAFDIDISPRWLVPENFNTVDALENMINAILDEQ